MRTSTGSFLAIICHTQAETKVINLRQDGKNPGFQSTPPLSAFLGDPSFHCSFTAYLCGPESETGCHGVFYHAGIFWDTEC